MKIYSQPLGVAATNPYLFVDDTSGKAVLFDAPEGAFEWVEAAKQESDFDLEALYLTHGHYDHIMDGWKFVEAGVPVWGHRDDRRLFEEPAVQSSFLFGGLDLRAVKIDHWLVPGETLTILGKAVEVRHVPGHCPGNVLFYFAYESLAIVGDAIFAGSIGRTDLPGGSMAVLEESIRTQIYGLPEETRLLSGHGPVTSVAREKATNPYVRRVMEAVENYMSEALAEAGKGWGKAYPNPMVGAVIVENGVIVSRGYHAKAGGPHAEIVALSNLGRKPANGAAMYVTLEPCCTTGKTGPCTEAIKAAGIRKVVIGAIDPDHRHQGRGIDILRAAGVETECGILKDECEDLNLIFNHVSTSGAPLLAGKTATTLDGKVATRTGISQWITGELARADVMRWRRYFPAIAVGAGTVLADDPSLTSRLEGSVHCGVRFVFDRKLRTRIKLQELQIYNDAFKDKTIVVTQSSAVGLSDFEKKGILTWPLDSEGMQFWAAFKNRCLEASVQGIYFEGGPVLLSDLLAHKQLDYLFAYRSPKFLADPEAPAFISGQVIENMNAAFTLKQVRHAFFGEDQLMRGFVKYPT